MIKAVKHFLLCGTIHPSHKDNDEDKEFGIEDDQGGSQVQVHLGGGWVGGVLGGAVGDSLQHTLPLPLHLTSVYFTVLFVCTAYIGVKSEAWPECNGAFT